MRSRPGSEVATWSTLVEQKRRRDMDMMSRHGFFWCRDMNLMSRHRVASMRVATWIGLGGVATPT